MLLRFFPNLCLTDILLAVLRIPLCKNICDIILQAKCLHNMLCKSKTLLELLYHLVGAHDEVTFADGELAHACETVHFTRVFVAEES